MSLNIKEVEHLAKLSRIELSQAEKELYAKEISSILLYVNKLQEINVRGKGQGASNIEDRESRLREDKVVGISLAEQKELIELAPENQDGLVKTKAVFEH